MVRLLSRPAQRLARDGPSSAVALGSIELMPAKDSQLCSQRRGLGCGNSLVGLMSWNRRKSQGWS